MIHSEHGRPGCLCHDGAVALPPRAFLQLQESFPSAQQRASNGIPKHQLPSAALRFSILAVLLTVHILQSPANAWRSTRWGLVWTSESRPPSMARAVTPLLAAPQSAPVRRPSALRWWSFGGERLTSPGRFLGCHQATNPHMESLSAGHLQTRLLLWVCWQQRCSRRHSHSFHFSAPPKWDRGLVFTGGRLPSSAHRRHGRAWTRLARCQRPG